MAMTGRLLPLLICLSYFVAGMNGDGETSHDVVEGEKVELPCNADPAKAGGLIAKVWYKGREDGTNTDGVTLFTFTGGRLTISSNRTDMSVPNTDSFAMIIGETRMGDDGTFACKIQGFLNVSYGYHIVSVRVLPKIMLHGLEKTFYQENETVTVTCEIPRVKPKPPANSVRFRWGGEDIPMSESPNLDSTFRYIGSKAKMLSRDDNGKLVRCDITTANGTLTQENSLVVHYGPSGVPKMSASEKEVYLQDTLTLICDRSTINDGNPDNYKYLWYRNDTLLEETAYKQYKLVIQNIDDAGNYSCAIKNGLSSTDRSEPVTIRVHSIVDPDAGVSTAAIAGGAACGVILVLILAVVFFVLYKKRRSGHNKDKPGQHELHNSSGSLNRMVPPAEGNGEAQYSEILDGRKLGKPIPAKRSQKRPEEPVYSEAKTYPEQEYAQIRKAPSRGEDRTGEVQYANVGGNVDRNQNQNPALVYAELALSHGQPDQNGIRPQDSEPTQYAQIDFQKGGNN